MAGSALQASSAPGRQFPRSNSTRRPFLTAAWRHLAMLNYRVDPQCLLPLVPRGTQLDLYHGEAIVTLVGFMFERARLFGIRVPWHQQFAEVNLRFYVRRQVDGHERRGVVFIKEMVPKRLVAWTARYIYGERFARIPVVCRREIQPGIQERFTYSWGRGSAGGELGIMAKTHLPAMLPEGEAAFVIDRSWAYTVGRGGRCREYFVRHEPWRIWPAHSGQLIGKPEAWYGPQLGFWLQSPCLSAFTVDGSDVEVFRSDQ